MLQRGYSLEQWCSVEDGKVRMRTFVAWTGGIFLADWFIFLNGLAKILHTRKSWVSVAQYERAAHHSPMRINTATTSHFDIPRDSLLLNPAR